MADGWSLRYWRRGRRRDTKAERSTLNAPAGTGRVRSMSGPRRKTWPSMFRAGPLELNLALHWGVVQAADSTATYRTLLKPISVDMFDRL